MEPQIWEEEGGNSSQLGNSEGSSVVTQAGASELIVDQLLIKDPYLYCILSELKLECIICIKIYKQK